jgi:dTDP-glucose pyrophosphorylase
MLQWGTPEDIEEYNVWSKYFKNAVSEEVKPTFNDNSITLIPLAGHGSRFVEAGYNNPKPLISVSGKPMIIQAAKSLPSTKDYIFVTLREHLETYNLQKILKQDYPEAKIISIDEVTEGQAITCSLGLINVNPESSLLIAATDNGMIYNKQEYQKLVESEDVDAIIFTFRGHVSSKNNPEMYGWVNVDNTNNAIGVSVKIPISEKPSNDHAIVGTFWFKKVDYYNRALERLIDKNIRVNNEYYVDSLIGELINMDFNVKVFEVDDYICWGTPDDYETFVYWQSFFHKSSWHPYSLEGDITVGEDELTKLNEKYRTFSQES